MKTHFKSTFAVRQSNPMVKLQAGHDQNKFLRRFGSNSNFVCNIRKSQLLQLLQKFGSERRAFVWNFCSFDFYKNFVVISSLTLITPKAFHSLRHYQAVLAIFLAQTRDIRVTDSPGQVAIADVVTFRTDIGCPGTKR